MIKRGVALVVLVGSVCFALPLIGDSGSTEAAGLLAGRVHGDFQPTDGKIFVLVIGNDARSGNPDRARADAVHIAGIDTKTMKGGILNFPRDSWVNIPGHGSGRINEALYRGGPELLARTLESITGIHIDYWVMTGFVGFQHIIKNLHGVKYKIDRDIYDPGGSGARIPAGTKWLGPASALAFVRTRHSFPNGDIDRTTNQARFLLALLRKLRGEVSRSPASLLRWMAVTRAHTRLDIGADKLFDLGVLASHVKPSDVGIATVPVTVGSVGAASVVFIQPGAHAIYQRFRSNARL